MNSIGAAALAMQSCALTSAATSTATSAKALHAGSITDHGYCHAAAPVRCEINPYPVIVSNALRGAPVKEHLWGQRPSRRSLATRLQSGNNNGRSALASVLLLRGRSVIGARAACTVATIGEGGKLPEADLSYFDKEGNVHTVKVSELTRAKKVVIFGVPGPFTPTCSTQHLPGFVAKAEELACVSVNDAFVMRAWGEQLNVGDNVLLLSDGLGKFTAAMGATVDLSDKPVGLGVRSRRYSMLVDDGVVKTLHMEEGGAFTTSSAEEILKSLQKPKAPSVECAGHNVM